MIEPLADSIVRKQLPRLIADAEALVGTVAWRDLPAGLRIIDCAGGRLAGFSSGSGHGLAQAHGCRPGAVAIAVAAEAYLRELLELWPDDTATGLAEAGLYVEFVAAHELAHALVADIDSDLQPGEADILRRLPAAVGTGACERSPERTARQHGPAWAAAFVILAGRCGRSRPGARHRWPHLLDVDLRRVGIDARAVADVVADVADELPLREFLSPQGAIVARVAEAIPDEAARARLIAGRSNKTTPSDPGHVAPVADGVGFED